MSVKLSSKFQVVIPENVRASLNLKPGALIDVIAKGGIVYLVPVKSLEEIRKSINAVTLGLDRKNLREKKDREI